MRNQHTFFLLYYLLHSYTISTWWMVGGWTIWSGVGTCGIIRGRVLPFLMGGALDILYIQHYFLGRINN